MDNDDNEIDDSVVDSWEQEENSEIVRKLEEKIKKQKKKSGRNGNKGSMAASGTSGGDGSLGNILGPSGITGGDSQQPAQIRILKRPPQTAPGGGRAELNNESGLGNSSNTIKSLAQREAEYAAARKRILGTSDDSKVTLESPNRSPSMPVKSSMSTSALDTLPYRNSGGGPSASNASATPSLMAMNFQQNPSTAPANGNKIIGGSGDSNNSSYSPASVAGIVGGSGGLAFSQMRPGLSPAAGGTLAGTQGPLSNGYPVTSGAPPGPRFIIMNSSSSTGTIPPPLPPGLINQMASPHFMPPSHPSPHQPPPPLIGGIPVGGHLPPPIGYGNYAGMGGYLGGAHPQHPPPFTNVMPYGAYALDVRPRIMPRQPRQNDTSPQ